MLYCSFWLALSGSTPKASAIHSTDRTGKRKSTRNHRWSARFDSDDGSGIVVDRESHWASERGKQVPGAASTRTRDLDALCVVRGNGTVLDALVEELKDVKDEVLLVGGRHG